MNNRLTITPEQTTLSNDTIMEGPSGGYRDDHGLMRAEFDEWLEDQVVGGRFDIELTPLEAAEMWGLYWEEHAGPKSQTF